MDVSDLFFFLLGQGEGGVRAVGGWKGYLSFLLKIPGGGGVSGGSGARAERMLVNFGGEGGGKSPSFPKGPKIEKI